MSYKPQKPPESRKLALKPLLAGLVVLGIVNLYLANEAIWWIIGIFGAYSIGYWVGYFARTKDEEFKTDLNWAVTSSTYDEAMSGCCEHIPEFDVTTSVSIASSTFE